MNNWKLGLKTTRSGSSYQFSIQKIQSKFIREIKGEKIYHTSILKKMD